MTLRKVLIYGGCHALVLRNLLAAFFPDEVAATLLVNFDLIRRAEPFPFDQLRNYECVLFSPIENKGAYNTIHLVEACRTLGVDAFCFPWLEWHGYCPGAAKGEFKNRFQWRYAGLAEAAASFDRFEDFAAWAIEAYPDDATIDETFARSLAFLSAAEERHAMPIRASDYIREHYRQSRLFLISDHPSLAVYRHVLVQILDLIGLDGTARLALLDLGSEEPQWRWRTPIFPRVAERLDLRFADTLWIDDDVVPGRSLDLQSYLRLYYYENSVILAPLETASILPRPTVGGSARVETTARIVADRVGDARADDTHDEYRLLDVLSGGAMPIQRNQRFAIDRQQWRSAWG